jgi:hypothetical protein
VATLPERPVLVAPDSFKGTFRATEVAGAIGRGLERAGLMPPDLCPVADGGDGTLEALVVQLGGETAGVRVRDPLGREIQAGYALLEGGDAANVPATRHSGVDAATGGRLVERGEHARRRHAEPLQQPPALRGVVRQRRPQDVLGLDALRALALRAPHGLGEHGANGDTPVAERPRGAVRQRPRLASRPLERNARRGQRCRRVPVAVPQDPEQHMGRVHLRRTQRAGLRAGVLEHQPHLGRGQDPAGQPAVWRQAVESAVHSLAGDAERPRDRAERPAGRKRACDLLALELIHLLA